MPDSVLVPDSPAAKPIPIGPAGVPLATENPTESPFPPMEAKAELVTPAMAVPAAPVSPPAALPSATTTSSVSVATPTTSQDGVLGAPGPYPAPHPLTPEEARTSAEGPPSPSEMPTLRDTMLHGPEAAVSSPAAGSPSSVPEPPASVDVAAPVPALAVADPSAAATTTTTPAAVNPSAAAPPPPPTSDISTAAPAPFTSPAPATPSTLSVEGAVTTTPAAPKETEKEKTIVEAPSVDDVMESLNLNAPAPSSSSSSSPTDAALAPANPAPLSPSEVSIASVAPVAVDTATATPVVEVPKTSDAAATTAPAVDALKAPDAAATAPAADALNAAVTTTTAPADALNAAATTTTTAPAIDALKTSDAAAATAASPADAPSIQDAAPLPRTSEPPLISNAASTPAPAADAWPSKLSADPMQTSHDAAVSAEPVVPESKADANARARTRSPALSALLTSKVSSHAEAAGPSPSAGPRLPSAGVATCALLKSEKDCLFAWDTSNQTCVWCTGTVLAGSLCASEHEALTLDNTYLCTQVSAFYPGSGGSDQQPVPATPSAPSGSPLIAQISTPQASPPTADHGPYVHDVTPLNVKDFIGHGVPLLLDFYAPWCPHSKALQPHFLQLAANFRNVPLAFAMFDADKYGVETAKKFGMMGFPTVVFYDGKGFMEEYMGVRELDEMAKWLSVRVNPLSRTSSHAERSMRSDDTEEAPSSRRASRRHLDSSDRQSRRDRDRRERIKHNNLVWAHSEIGPSVLQPRCMPEDRALYQ